jgi:hypothetical protein
VTWTAPAVDRQPTLFVGDEREMLESWLTFHRLTLQSKCAGLTGEQLATRSTPPSSLSLLGLVRHMTEVERSWFRRRFAGEDVGFVYCGDGSNDDDIDEVDAAAAEADFAAYADELVRCDAAARGHGLDETFRHERLQLTMNLRWVYVHMVEEYARHNGHADLLRERVDGATGE